MKLKFDTRGNEKQKECVKAWIDPLILHLYYFGVKGAAKSFTGVSLIFGNALMYPGTKYFIARKELKDLRLYTLPTIKEVFDIWGLTDDYYNFNQKDNFFTLYNGSTVYFIDAGYEPSDPLYTRFGSQQYTQGWFEEVGELQHAAIRNLSAAVGRWKNDIYNLVGKTLRTGNPCQNFVYEVRKRWKQGLLNSFEYFISTDRSDNKAISKDYYENLERNLSDEEKERLLYDNWDYSNDPAVLCKPNEIQDIFTNNYIDVEILTKKGFEETKRLSADLAMQGRDKFLAVPHSQLKESFDPSKHNDENKPKTYLLFNFLTGIEKDKSGGKEIETDLKDLMIRDCVRRSQVVTDSNGLGAYLESYLEGIKTFISQQSAENKVLFANIRSECGYKLAEFIKKGLIRIICNQDQKERIIRELSQLKEMFPDENEKRKRIIPKDDMKKFLGFSPDFLDVLIMAMIFELKPDVEPRAVVTYGERKNYDNEFD